MKNQNEIIKDLINFLTNQEPGDLIHIDNLREEIENQPQNFGYTLSEFNETLNQIF